MVSGELARKQCRCTGLISPEIEIERSGQVQHDVVGKILPLFVMVNALMKMPRARPVGSFRLASRPMPTNRQAKGSSKYLDVRHPDNGTVLL